MDRSNLRNAALTALGWIGVALTAYVAAIMDDTDADTEEFQTETGAW